MQAKDAYGNDLTSGGLTTVTITKYSGTGSIGAVTDNLDGTYTATVTAPTATGSGVFVATLNTNPVKSGGADQTQATVSYLAGPASQIALKAGNDQSATVGTAVASAPSVIVSDAHNNPVSGVSVSFAGPAAAAQPPTPRPPPTPRASPRWAAGPWAPAPAPTP